MRKWQVAIAVSVGLVGLGGAASVAASAHPGGATVSVGGAVAAPATYSVDALRAMPQSTFSVTRGTHAATDQGVSLESLVDASMPQLPNVKNGILTAILTVADPLGVQRTFALGELDASFGNHPAYIALDENGVRLDRPELIVPGDRNDARSVPDVSEIGVAIEDPAVLAPPEVGALAVQDGGTTTVLGPRDLASLPQHSLTVTYIGPTGPQTHTETGPTLDEVLHAAHIQPDLNTWAAGVGSDGYVATVTPAEAWVGGRPLLISLSEDGQSFLSQSEGPRLVADGDVKGGRYDTGMDDLWWGGHLAVAVVTGPGKGGAAEAAARGPTGAPAPRREGQPARPARPRLGYRLSTITVVDLTIAVAWSPGLRPSSSAASLDISETIR